MPAEERMKVKLSSALAGFFYLSFSLMGQEMAERVEQRGRDGGDIRKRLYSVGVRCKRVVKKQSFFKDQTSIRESNV